MGKVIAIWGSPNSGKTTFSVKLAKAIYDSFASKIICVSADIKTPTLPVIFPNKPDSELHSIGDVLSKTEITSNDVFKSMVSISKLKNFAFMGYNIGENIYTYPAYSDEKAATLIDTLISNTDFVIIDCTSDLADTLSEVAIQKADIAFRLCAPDLKSISYFSSQQPLFADSKFKLDTQICGLVVIDNDVFMPIEEAKQHFKEIRFTVPYSKEVKEQMLNGTLLRSVSDKKFNSRIKAIIDKVV